MSFVNDALHVHVANRLSSAFGEPIMPNNLEGRPNRRVIETSDDAVAPRRIEDSEYVPRKAFPEILSPDSPKTNKTLISWLQQGVVRDFSLTGGDAARWDELTQSDYIDAIFEDAYQPPYVFICDATATVEYNGISQPVINCVDGRERLRAILAFARGVIPCHDGHNRRWYYTEPFGRENTRDPRRVLSEAQKAIFDSKQVRFVQGHVNTVEEEQLFFRLQRSLTLERPFIIDDLETEFSDNPWFAVVDTFAKDFEIIIYMAGWQQRWVKELFLLCFIQILEVKRSENGQPERLFFMAEDCRHFLSASGPALKPSRIYLARVFNLMKKFVEAYEGLPRITSHEGTEVVGTNVGSHAPRKSLAPVETIAIVVLIAIVQRQLNAFQLKAAIEEMLNKVRGLSSNIRLNQDTWDIFWAHIARKHLPAPTAAAKMPMITGSSLQMPTNSPESNLKRKADEQPPYPASDPKQPRLSTSEPRRQMSPIRQMADPAASNSMHDPPDTESQDQTGTILAQSERSREPVSAHLDSPAEAPTEAADDPNLTRSVHSGAEESLVSNTICQPVEAVSASPVDANMDNTTSISPTNPPPGSVATSSSPPPVPNTPLYSTPTGSLPSGPTPKSSHGLSLAARLLQRKVLIEQTKSKLPNAQSSPSSPTPGMLASTEPRSELSDQTRSEGLPSVETLLGRNTDGGEGERAAGSAPATGVGVEHQQSAHGGAGGGPIQEANNDGGGTKAANRSDTDAMDISSEDTSSESESESDSESESESESEGKWDAKPAPPSAATPTQNGVRMYAIERANGFEWTEF